MLVEYRTGVGNINSFYVRNSKNEMTLVGLLVTVSRVFRARIHNRFKMFRSIQINGSSAPDVPFEVAQSRWKKAQKKCAIRVWLP